jgi:hypothetical protein
MSMTVEKTAQDHGRSNAVAWVESLNEYVAKLTREGAARFYADSKTHNECVDLLIENGNTVDPDLDTDGVREQLTRDIDDGFDPDDFKFDEDAAREEIQESPLSVQVRSGWHNPGEESDAAEFEILLTTGGPALRIRGDLDEHKQPDRAWLEYQDWGTPWTQYFDVEQETLLEYCRCFYFGE